MMLRAIGVIVVLVVSLPFVSAQPAPGPACAPTDVQRDQKDSDEVGSVQTEGLNQLIVVRWSPLTAAGENASVVGYRVWVYEQDGVRVYETSSTECRVSGVNGRLYAVEVAPVFDDGTLGRSSPPRPVEPALQNDFLYLALGLAVVWLGVWAYAGLLVRQQRRLTERYEALLKHPGPADGP